MKRLFSLFWFAAMAVLCAAQTQPVLQYDFSRSEGAVVRDASGSGLDGRLCGSARLERRGRTALVNLGYDGGYVDMGPQIGRILKGSNSFTVAVKYLVEEDASLQGNGYFLWAFSTQELNTRTEGRTTPTNSISSAARTPSAAGPARP